MKRVEEAEEEEGEKEEEEEERDEETERVGWRMTSNKRSVKGNLCIGLGPQMTRAALLAPGQ